MNDKYIPALTMLLAGSITSVMSIVLKKDVLQSLILLLVVMVVFYILGILARKIIRKVKNLYLEDPRDKDKDKGDATKNEDMDGEEEETKNET